MALKYGQTPIPGLAYDVEEGTQCRVLYEGVSGYVGKLWVRIY